MPELPEVETVCRGLAPHLEGRVLARVEVRREGLRRPFPRDLAERLVGRRVMAIGRRAKYVLIDLDDGGVVIAHLGMSGRILLTGGPDTPPDTPPGPHDHLLLDTDGGLRVTFNDARRFGLVDLGWRATLADHPLLAGLGPEPLGSDFDGDALAARLAGRSGAIKTTLLDQGVVAGLGNIYVSESLFHARIDPRDPAATVSGRRAGRLARAIRQVLERAIAAGGSSLRDYRQASGELGYFQHQFAVYDRAGQPCRGCDCELGQTGGVQRIVQGGRSTFYCPARQR